MGERREVRPTIRVLKNLPRETYDDTTPLDLIGNSDYARLDLYGVKHPLLENARDEFASGLPDKHRRASKKWKQPAYEVRDHDGAGWRGAVVLDPDGDPWLVWVEKHNKFHNTAGDTALAGLMPTESEYKLRDREEAALKKQAWRRRVLELFVDAIRDSIKTDTEVTIAVPDAAGATGATLTISAMHDEPDEDASLAHNGQTLLTISMKIGGGEWTDFNAALTRTCLAFLEPDHTKVRPVFGQDGSLTAHVDLTHAQVIQLLADPPTYDAEAPEVVTPTTHLHYVGVIHRLEGFVNGTPVRGVCGDWFIVSQGPECGLPICERCEAEHGAAQVVLNWLRSHR